MSPSDRGLSKGIGWTLALHIRLVAASIPLLDRLLTLERMLKLLTPHRPSRMYAAVEPDTLATMVRRRLREPRQMRRRACLRLSLVLYHFLRLAGRDAVFHTAVYPPSMDPKRLHAHCWVTVGDTCICEPPGSKAVEMFTYGLLAQDRPASATRPQT